MTSEEANGGGPGPTAASPAPLAPPVAAPAPTAPAQTPAPPKTSGLPQPTQVPRLAKPSAAPAPVRAAAVASAGHGGQSAALALAQATNARKIWVYRNGDRHFPGRRILVNDRRYKNFEQFLSSLTGDVALRSGAVRKIYDLSGRRIESLNDISDCSFYVAAGSEPFRPVAYPSPAMATDAQPPINATSSVPPPATCPTAGEPQDPCYTVTRGDVRVSIPISKMPLPGEKAFAFLGERKKWGSWKFHSPRLHDPHGRPSQTSLSTEKPIFQANSKGYRVAVFRNGDLLTPPARMVLSFRNCHTFDQLMVEMTTSLRLKEGRVKRLFDAESFRPIKTLHDLHDGQNLIASGTSDPAKRITYPLVDFTVPTEVRRVSQMATDKGKVIHVFPNGDTLHTGVKVTVTAFRFKNDLKKLVEYLAHEVPLYTGRLTALYTTSGELVTAIDQLTHNGTYVAVSGTDPFLAVKYNADAYRRRTGAASAAAAAPAAAPAGPPVALTQGSMSRATAVLERSKKLLEEKSGGPRDPVAAAAATSASPHRVPAPAAATPVADGAGVHQFASTSDSARDLSLKRKPTHQPTSPEPGAAAAAAAVAAATAATAGAAPS
ncbi:Doublecortin domain-containing protein 2 [Allomyces javanicus]|nr:Doublecortin domain-containing protein 2 [Allomyces javanicus]